MSYLYILLLVLGMTLGPCMMLITNHFITVRTGNKPNGLFVSNKRSWVIWSIMGAIGFLIISLLSESSLVIIQYMAIYLVLISLSVVDVNIRKIPNELLLALLLIKVIFIVVSGTWSLLLSSQVHISV